MNDSLKTYVQKIDKLPTLPVIAQEILSLVGNNLISVGKIEKVVENDPAISAKILSVANSAFFSLKVRTKTLDSAIMRIGFDNVKNIALGISLMTVLQDGERGNVFDYKRVYNHSVTVGFLCRLLARNLKLDFADEVMMIGMLHDIGYLVLNKYFPKPYGKVYEAFHGGLPLLEAEKDVLGFDHTDIGTWLAVQWNLPGPVVDSIQFHHAPSAAKKNLKRIAVAHLADFLTTKSMLSPTDRNPEYPFDSRALELLNITEEDFQSFETEIRNEGYSAEIF
jgi:putative nucleotidyltransferase with HDIG domain